MDVRMVASETIYAFDMVHKSHCVQLKTVPISESRTAVVSDMAQRSLDARWKGARIWHSDLVYVRNMVVSHQSARLKTVKTVS